MSWQVNTTICQKKGHQSMTDSIFTMFCFWLICLSTSSPNWLTVNFMSIHSDIGSLNKEYAPEIMLCFVTSDRWSLRLAGTLGIWFCKFKLLKLKSRLVTLSLLMELPGWLIHSVDTGCSCEVLGWLSLRAWLRILPWLP